MDTVVDNENPFAAFTAVEIPGEIKPAFASYEVVEEAFDLMDEYHNYEHAIRHCERAVRSDDRPDFHEAVKSQLTSMLDRTAAWCAEGRNKEDIESRVKIAFYSEYKDLPI